MGTRGNTLNRILLLIDARHGLKRIDYMFLEDLKKFNNMLNEEKKALFNSSFDFPFSPSSFTAERNRNKEKNNNENDIDPLRRHAKEVLNRKIERIGTER